MIPLPLRIGGLMRCCIGTYNDDAPPAADTSEGDTLDCKWCESRLVVRNSKWQWDREHDLARYGRR